MGDMGHWDSGTKLHLTQNQTKTSMKSKDSIKKIHEFISLNASPSGEIYETKFFL